MAERLAELCAVYDDTPANRQILATVARFLDDAERGRTAYTRTRAANSARRLLAGIPRKPEPPPPNHIWRLDETPP